MSNFEYILVNIKNMLLVLKEYKLNAFTQFFNQIIYFATFFLFFEALSSLLGRLQYSRLELFVYLILIDLCVTGIGVFDWGKSLKQDITRGIFNSYLIRPKNIFLLYQFSRLNSNAFIQHIVGWFVLVGLVVYYELMYLFSVGVMILLVFVFIFYVLIRFMTSSISFYNFALSEILYQNVFRAGSSAFKQYPAQFFELFPYQKLLMIFPMFFMGALVFELGLFNSFIISYFLILLFLISVCIILTFLLWKFGLRRYDAYG